MRSALALALLLSAATASAQSYRFRTYTSNSGLPANSVYGIFQDKDGYIWFATDAGAARYDGRRFTTYSVRQGLADPSVRAFVEDSQGRLWITTKGGISRMDPGGFTTFTVKDGLPINETRCALRTRDGTLWFGTSNGLARYDGRAFHAYGTKDGLPPGPVWALVEDHKGTLWLGLRGGGLARRDGERFVAYGRADGLSDLNVFSLAEDPAGGLWIGSDGGLTHFDVDGARFQHYAAEQGLANSRVSSVLVDRHGRVWCGTFGGGLARFEDGRFSLFGRQNGLPDEYVISLFKDREENIWAGGLWGGAYRFISERFANYTAANGIGDGMVSGLAEAPDGTLWLSSIVSGLSAMDPKGGVKRYGVGEGLKEPGVWTLLVDRRGQVWTGGLGGVSRFDGKAFRDFGREEMGATDRINAIAEDGSGRLWFGSGGSRSNGVLAYDGHRFQVYGKEQGLSHLQVNTLTTDRSGRLWACTEDGLCRLDGERFTCFRKQDGLPSKRAIVAYEDKQGLWVGTDDGLGLFDGHGFQVFRTREGLADNFVHSLTSRGGTLWIGTAQGISRLDHGQFQSFTAKDGLISHETSTSAALCRRDGSVWFGTAQGAVRYQEVKQSAVELPPRVKITGIEVKDGALPLADHVRLSYARNSPIFDFLGVSFLDEDGVRYSYMLEGLDTEWSPPSEWRSVRFTNLEPGSYRFVVKARSAAGLWSEPAAMALDVLPPFWRTWWFRSLAVLTIGGLGYAAYGWRVRRIEQAHRARIEALRQLLDSIRVINSTLDLATVLQNIAAQSAELVGGVPGGIGLVREQRVLFERIWAGDHWEARDVSYAMGDRSAGRVAATGQTVIVPGPTLADLAASEESVSPGPAGRIDVPIVNRMGEVVGVLDVRQPPTRTPFGPAEQQLLEALAHQAAIAIENAALYADLGEKKVQISESLWAVEELYKNEQEMTRALEELNRMKNDFMIVTSHEMRTPLTLLKGYHEALLDGYLGALSPAQRQCVTQGHKATERMIGSFEDILEMLRIDERRTVLARKPMDLAAESSEVVAALGPFIEKRGQRVHVLPNGGTHLVQADPAKLRLVLVNLLENAIKFTPDGGEVRLQLTQGPSEVHLMVEDTGIGIEAAELERVFERFYAGADSLHHSSGTYQFRSRGAGLGLAIAKGYVEAHGGRIWAESDGPGKGSRFHVVLPMGADA